MANEIQSSKSISANKGGASVSKTTSATVSMVGADMVQSTQLIGTSAELLTWGDITGAPEEVQIVNLDATNFVELALDSGNTQKFAKLKPGRSIQWPPAVANIYATANTADVLVSKVAVET